MLASVSLTAISDDQYGLEAALKYILISSMGTLFLLLGIGALYATFGTLNMADIAGTLLTGERPFLAPASAIMLLCAFLLKSAVFPFHFWQPDFHTTAPTPISAMLSSIVVKVGVYGIFPPGDAAVHRRSALARALAIHAGNHRHTLWQPGRPAHLQRQTHAGLFDICPDWLYPRRHRLGETAGALIGAIVYAFNHAFIKSSLLMLMGVVASYTKTKTANFADISGIGGKLPTVARLAGMLIGGLSLAGMPPLNGFISKLALIQGGVDRGDWANLLIMVGRRHLDGDVYGSRLAAHLSAESACPARSKPKTKATALVAPFLLICACLLLGTILAEPMVQLISETVRQLGDPQIYISAVNLPNAKDLKTMVHV